MLKLWFKRATAADGNVPPGVQYIYFNHKEWERQFFAGSAQMIVSFFCFVFLWVQGCVCALYTLVCVVFVNVSERVFVCLF